MAQPLRFLTQRLAQEVDVQLMGPTYGFSIDQLMELAGLAVAYAVAHEYPPALFGRRSAHAGKHVGIVCGPGNNGGDGLVAARHLFHFGYSPEIIYPRAGKGVLFENLVKQCRSLDIPIREAFPDGELDARYSLLVDGIFGFSFSGAVRPPFDSLLARMNARRRAALPLVSIDIPSGWDVERGPVGGGNGGLDLHAADTLVSLTAPKLCARHFRGGGGHFVGGRFVPPQLAASMGFAVPEYQGTNQIVRLRDDYGDDADGHAAPATEAATAVAAAADSCPRSGL